MRAFSFRPVGRAILGAAVFICLIAAPAIPAFSAGYPRQVAIAPFVSLAKEDIGPTVAVLPRLLASRLMALAGADVLLLPPGGKAPEEAAKDANFPLLIQGTVAKLGKGYSIDATATDLITGRSAGAFFASAASEDDIIPQLGALSGEIAEKLFGVQPAVRAVPPPPAPPPAQAAPSAAAPAPLPGGAASRGVPPAPAASPAPGTATAAPPPPKWFTGGHVPAAIERVAQSDAVPDALYRVAVGDVDGDGFPEIIATGERTVWFYKLKGDEIVPYPPTRMTRSGASQLLNVEIFDADGDGKPEIFVTELRSDRLYSFVLQNSKGVFETVASDLPFFIVLLSDLEGKPVLAGQRTGYTEIFQRFASPLEYKGGQVTEGKDLKPPLDDGIFGLNAVPVGKDGRFVYVDADEHLRLLDMSGKTLTKTKDYFARGVLNVSRGLPPRGEVSPPQTWIRGRVIPVGREDGDPWLLTRQAEGAEVMRALRNFSNSRIVVGKYEGEAFSVRVTSPPSAGLITDAVPMMGEGGGDAVVVAVVREETSSALSEARSRIVLYKFR